MVIKTSDTNLLHQIAMLPFVKKIMKRPVLDPLTTGSIAGQLVKPGHFMETLMPVASSARQGESLYDYGEAFSQISMVRGTVLHDDGYRGQGIGIAVLDGGFIGTNLITLFDSLRGSNRIMGTINYVGGGTYVYQGTSHGTSVLSTMAANTPGTMIGTAPMADYWLIRSEELNAENIIEEYNWAAGAEYADSVGADIISSSLSYRTFTLNTYNHTYEETDGNTAPSTIAADIACAKGMIVVVSAGNSAQDWNWPHIAFPADGDSVFTVGAIDAHGIYAPFSSVGPTIDKRIKPDAVAKGIGTIVASQDGSLAAANGTSFSTPIIAGMIACLWQRFPQRNNMKIIDAVRQSCSHASSPDTLTGYGIPDFSRAGEILMGADEMRLAGREIRVFPNPCHTSLTIHVPDRFGNMAGIEILSTEGITMLIREAEITPGTPFILNYELENLEPGIYLLKVTGKENVFISKIIKN
jgi:subtilisin family serine protease